MDIVIGVSAYPGGGKDFVADIIAKRFHFYKVVPGDIVRKLMKENKIKITRENEIKFSNYIRKKNGSEFLMKMCYESAKEDGANKIVVAGIRTLGDIRFFRKNDYIFFKNIFVEAPAKLRYQRILERGREDAPPSFRDFLKQDKLEAKNFGLDKIKEASDYIIHNNKSKEEVEKRVIKLVEKILEEYKKLNKK